MMQYFLSNYCKLESIILKQRYKIGLFPEKGTASHVLLNAYAMVLV